MHNYIVLPPLRQSGGLAVLHNLAAHLQALHYPVTLVVREPMHTPLPFETVNFEQVKPKPNDIWLVPEGWPSLLLKGLQLGARVVVYVQNWAYLFGGMEDKPLPLEKLPLQFLTVSEPVAWHLKLTLGKDSQILRPGLDLELFHPTHISPKAPIRIAFMPRKNKALTTQIQHIVMARKLTVEWVSIHNMPHTDVANILRSCHIFLATGFPEGCPLPPLEAMASGCLVVGFGGFGGFDYMRQAWDKGFLPWWPLGDVSWGGNGFYCPDADTIGAALALEEGVNMYLTSNKRLEEIKKQAAQTALAYSAAQQNKNIDKIWKNFHEQTY